MVVAPMRIRAPRVSLTRLEPLVPLFLGLHGLTSMLISPGPVRISLGFIAVCALGLAGLAGWTSTRAVILRAASCVVVALAVQLYAPNMVPAMLQWYYCVAAVYSLLLSRWPAALIGPICAACYYVQVLLGSAPVPLPVAALRSGVLTALGVVMYLAGRAYREQRVTSERGQARAEAMSAQLSHAITHDALTDFPTRERFLTTVQETLSGSGAAAFAVLVLDVDRFKSVNDALGHAKGNQLLHQVAQRLRCWAADTAMDVQVSMIARLDGDGFGVFLSATRDTAHAAAERLLRVFEEPVVVDGQPLRMTVSIGLAHAGAGGATATELLRSADLALYEAKDSGRNRVIVHDAAMSPTSTWTLDLEQDLRNAVKSGQIWLQYQPIAHLASHRFRGVEALARWTREGSGPVPPDMFIAAAEGLGIIGELGRQVLVQALDALTGWRREGLPLEYIAVNVSPLQLGDATFAEVVADLLAVRGLAPESLVLEVTEGAVMQASPRVSRTLESLRALGVSLSMDDFGTGYSSLTRLRQLPVTEIKIDRSFVAELPDDDTLPRIVIELARRLGVHSVAEGVETAEQLAVLESLGCVSAQGYYLSRPMGASDIPAAIWPDHAPVAATSRSRNSR